MLGNKSWKKVKKIIEDIVIKTRIELVFISKFDDEKIQGIIKNITKGLVMPPVRYNKKLNWKISIFKKRNDNLLVK